MPKYLKNRRRRRHSVFNRATENIPMSSEKDVSKQQKNRDKKESLKILRGKKKTKQIKKIVFFSLVFVVAISVTLVSVLSPTGISELITNFSATFSFNSDFPVTLNGSETYNVSTIGNRVFVLSDTDFSCYSKQGNFSFSDAHGFASPVMVESQSRCLVYDQNSKGYKIYNAKELILDSQFEFAILGADISRNGSYAIASKSQSHTSMVTVYNKKNEMQYQWYCPQETITSVALSPNGKQISVSTVSVSGGNYNSKLHILQYDSADPVYSKEYVGALVYGIDSISNKNFTVIGENFCDIISWKNHNITTFTTPYSVDDVRTSMKYTAIMSSREHNDGNATFTIYNNKQQLLSSFDFKGSTDDFALCGKSIMVLSRNKIFLVDSNGNIVKNGDCGFGIIKILPITSSSCIAVSHNNIYKISLQ
ncbi:MAG: DUF5711 family protein [Acutalibacteraceae bacterium]|nr:DUF5711 family protein [Acutalibacteraceae bacterium]